jgi:hypothetical protein
MADYQLNRGQLDAPWSYIPNKGEKKTILGPAKAASSGTPP